MAVQVAPDNVKVLHALVDYWAGVDADADFSH